MKKILSVCLALVLLLAVIPLHVMASEDPTFMVGSASAYPGDTIQVPVSVGNNPGIVAYRLMISYDTDVLTLTNVENKNLFGSGNLLTSGSLQTHPYRITWEDSLSHENHEQDGALVVLTFQVSETATAGVSPITLEYDAGSTFNVDLDDVAFVVHGGAVTVEEQSQEEVKLVIPEGATTAIDESLNYIYGLKQMITKNELSDYLAVQGDGHLEYDYNAYIGTGTKVRVVDNATSETVETYTIIIFADLDGDGLTTNQDIIMAKQMNAGLLAFEMTEPAAYASDVFEDGSINNSDIIIMKNLQAGLIRLDQSTRVQTRA